MALVDLLQDTTVWVATSFAIFIIFAFKAIKTTVLTILDNSIREIKESIDQAENLRTEAKELLAQFQRKQKDALKDCKDILDTAQKQSVELQKNIDNETAALITLREQTLQERIRRMEEKAIADIRVQIAELAAEATMQILLKKLSKDENARLVDETIKTLPNNLKKVS